MKPTRQRTRGVTSWLAGPALVAIVALLLLVGGLATGSRSAHAAPRTALIDGDTVIGGLSSEEAQFATAQGFAVTVIPDSTWATYTAAQFGAYDLLIAGDPSCGSLPPGLISSASVYAPVVMGKAGGRTQAGNRILVGTDPVDHSGGHITSVRATIINDGIAFAGSQPGRTGMYYDTTCNDSGQAADILAIATALSSGSGAWTIDTVPPCGGNVSLIASEPSFATLTTASLEGWGCSVHESFPTFTTDWSALAVATDTASHPTCGVDPNTSLSACGEAYILIAGSSIVVTSGSISLTPKDATNPVGTDHTVTAHVTSGTEPVGGQLVTFTVTGQNAGASGTCVPVSCMTNASGDVSFTYHDTNGAGDDTIKASFTDVAGSLQAATAQKHWGGTPCGSESAATCTPVPPVVIVHQATPTFTATSAATQTSVPATATPVPPKPTATKASQVLGIVKAPNTGSGPGETQTRLGWLLLAVALLGIGATAATAAMRAGRR